MQQFKVGDKVRFLESQLPGWRLDLDSKKVYTVVTVETYGEDDDSPLVFLEGVGRTEGFLMSRFEPVEASVTAPKFKVGDGVLGTVEDSPGYDQSTKPVVIETRGSQIHIKFSDGSTGWFDEQRFEPKPTPESERSSFYVGMDLAAPENDGRAMRFNNSKSDLAYFLSFDGGPEILFPEDSDFHEAAVALGEWYRFDSCDGEESERLLQEAIDAFFVDCDCEDLCNDDWPEQFAAVCQFGAKKYARGNYLKGRGLHDTCNSLLRHMLQMDRGEEIDSDSKCQHFGHIVWNVMFLRHCYRTFGAKFDDRLRAPKVAA
jgi:hypothetical protein